MTGRRVSDMVRIVRALRMASSTRGLHVVSIAHLAGVGERSCYRWLHILADEGLTINTAPNGRRVWVSERSLLTWFRKPAKFRA